MTNNNPNPKFAPAAYQQHLTTAEFRFRWMDALVEVEDKWFKSSVAHLARALGSYMDRSGECWPAVSTLAHAMRVDQRTVRRALGALVEYGWLIAVVRFGNTNLYQAVLPEYGLELLLRSREKKADLPTAADWQEATYRVLDSACAAFGISRCDWATLLYFDFSCRPYTQKSPVFIGFYKFLSEEIDENQKIDRGI